MSQPIVPQRPEHPSASPETPHLAPTTGPNDPPRSADAADDAALLASAEPGTREGATPAEDDADDPAGPPPLRGRNRVGAGVRVLAGLALGSGMIASLGDLPNTSVSII
ncbi:hypothetical protein RM844_13785 [Streptomyces sp. DSM 44915]|uniref:Uncharacterized protein n=1 Tax=Streptomyces chisholmiae TaxID=3075540 RepID=A0ABU2JQU5_9ACTN|nr:hypothetical protein [Streptomyces sp. DSM 44915]MDT0267357.1 hypothetical protein [Streptomyces sp. DSM 44915]